jgi:hypothetical protein
VQFASLNTGLVFLIALGIAIAFAFATGGVILAIPIFLIVFFGFLVWRGSKRPARLGERYHTSGVPSTAEAAGDPVDDSALGDVREPAATPGAGEAPQRTRD